MPAPSQLIHTRMGTYRKWFKTIRRKLVRSSNREIIVVYTNTSPSTHEESADYQDLINGTDSSSAVLTERFWTKEDVAAIKLQAFFRGHLARQAFRALRSLVKLQALVRGVYVRKQSRIALHCMHALVRLQVKVHARQLLSTV